MDDTRYVCDEELLDERQLSHPTRRLPTLRLRPRGFTGWLLKQAVLYGLATALLYWAAPVLHEELDYRLRVSRVAAHAQFTAFLHKCEQHLERVPARATPVNRQRPMRPRTRPTPTSTTPAVKPVTVVATRPSAVTPAASPIRPAGTQSTSKVVVSARRASVLAAARALLGTPYAYGRAGRWGTDCSGLTCQAYARAGIALPRTSRAQYRTGTVATRATLQPADLVFFTTSGFGVSHVGVYAGNGQFIHAASSGRVMTSSLSHKYWRRRFVGGRSIL